MLLKTPHDENVANFSLDLEAS